MMQTHFAVYIGIVYTYLPFMILPLYANLMKLDERCSKRQPTSAPGRSRAFSTSPCRCRCPGSSPASCWSSFPQSANS